MLYYILKPFVKLSIRLYFKRIKIEGLENIPKNQPVVLAPNHPGAFLDPILLGTVIPRVFHILARGESFQSKLKALLFKSMKMIPVYRPDKSPDKMIKNKSVFRKCHEILGEGKNIMIFPEGLSKTEHRLRKIKTGAARMVLGYQESEYRNKNAVIVPIAINYDNPHLFQSKVYIKFGEPINVSKYEAVSENDRVRLLTEELKDSLLMNLKLIEDESHDELVEDIEKYYLNEYSYYRNASTNTKKVQVFNRTVDGVQEMKRKFPSFYDNMKKQLTEYTEDLKQCKINDKQIKVLNRVNWAFLLRLILLTPFAMLGVITHIVPYKLVHVIAENFSENNSFRGALKVSLGMLMFAITNLIWVSLFYAQFHSIPLSILMFFILPIVGIITFYWSRNLGLLMKWISIKYFKKEDYIRLQRRRVQLIYSIENYFES